MQSKDIAIRALFTAFVCVATMVLVVPIPATGGYFNLGETVIYIAAMLFGGVVGGFVGGIGSALADLLLGFSAFAPITLVVKGIEGFVVGTIAYKKKTLQYKVIALSCGGVVLVLGYFLAEVYLFGYPAALSEIPLNVLQFVSGAVLSLIIVNAIEKHKLFDKFF